MDSKIEKELLEHMQKQTVHAKYTADRLVVIEKQLSGVNVQEVKNDTKQNTIFISRLKGIGVAVAILGGLPSVVYAVVKLIP